MRIIDILKQTKLQDDFVPTDNAGVSLAHCDFSDSDAPVQKLRSLSANAQTGIIARHMLTGRHVTIAGAYNILKEDGNTSNDAGRRVREARVWLEKQGFKIEEQDCLSDDNVRYKSWRVMHDEELQQAALDKLKGKK